MKRLFSFSKIYRSIWCCLILLGLFGHAGFAQPVVTVPPTCEVLVTGSGVGVVLGFGGTVGSGGVVAMPDPFDLAGAPGNFTIIPNGTTGHGWRMLGDLSIQTAGALIPSGGGLIQNIESYNKNVRPSEGIFPSTSTLGRSKGRVTISYILAPCNASISFDVLKRFPNTGSGPGYVPPVIGPSCWDPSTVVTYSVDAVSSDNLGDAIGTDKYYWRVTNGGTTITPTYISSDASSITFTTPAVITGIWTVKCAFGRANPWDGDVIPFPAHTTVESKTIGTPVAITWTTAPPTCLNTNLTTFTATLSPVVGFNYSWSYVGSGTPTVVGSGAQNQTVTVSSMNSNPGKLVLTVTNTVGACPATMVFEYPVGRNFVAPFVLTTVPASPTCLNPGGTFTVSLPALAQLNNTTWTMPTGWSFTPSNAQASVITVTVPGTALGGQYTLTARSTACPTGIISLVVFVKPVPVFTAGPTCISSGSTAPIVYTVNAPGPGPFTYAWTIPPGWTGTSTTNTITVTPNGTSVGNVTCNVCTGTCCTSIVRSVGFNPVVPTIVAPTCYNVGLPGTAVFSIAAPVAGTYTWTVLPAFGTATTFTGTSFTVTTTGNPGTFTNAVTVTHSTTGCGSTAPVTVSPTLTANGSLSILTGGTFQVLSVIGATGSPTYQWLQNCGVAGEVVCTGCGTGANVLLANAASGGQWGAYVIAAGCTTRICTTTVYGNRLANPGTEAEGVDQLGNEVTLSPNPNNGEFEVRVENVQMAGEMIIFNSFGQQVFTGRLRAGANRFTQTQLASGIYFLHIVVDGKVSIKKMEVRH